jgi:hypothetical protein
LNQSLTEPGLCAAAAALSGLVLVRLLTLAISGGEATLPIWVGLALELGAALLNGVVLRRLHRGVILP